MVWLLCHPQHSERTRERQILWRVASCCPDIHVVAWWLRMLGNARCIRIRLQFLKDADFWRWRAHGNAHHQGSWWASENTWARLVLHRVSLKKSQRLFVFFVWCPSSILSLCGVQCWRASCVDINPAMHDPIVNFCTNKGSNHSVLILTFGLECWTYLSYHDKDDWRFFKVSRTTVGKKIKEILRIKKEKTSQIQ